MSETPSVQTLLEDLQHESWEIRQEATRQLKELPPNSHLEPLLQAATDPSMNVRLAVIESLQSHKDERIEAILLQALFDEEWEIQWAAMRVLGQLWNQPAMRKLGDKLPEKRISGLEQIAKEKNRQLLQPVLASLDDELDEVQETSIRTLAALQHPDAIPALRKLLPDATFTRKALLFETLSALGDLEASQQAHQFLIPCHECQHSLPPSFLTKVSQWNHPTTSLCQFHFEEFIEKNLPFLGKIKPCKLCKTHWPRIELIESTCPNCREHRYHALGPVGPDLFRCYRCQKQRPLKDHSPISSKEQPLCSKCASQLAQLCATPPFHTPHAIAFLEQAFDNGLLFCEKCRHFRPLDQIAEGDDFRDSCICQLCHK